MSFYGCVLNGDAKESVKITPGSVWTLASITLNSATKAKGKTEVRVKPAGCKSANGDLVATLSNKDKGVRTEVSLSFNATSSPVELWVVGDGKVHVIGSVTEEEKPKSGKKSKTETAAAKVEAVATTTASAKKVDKKRKAEEESAAPVAKAPKQDPLKPADMKKPWKVKPQNEEGVLVAKPKPVYKDKGLKTIDYVIGNGPYPQPGAPVKINYIGLLPDGTVFDSRIKRKEPLVFRKGVHQVVRGLDVGMEGMKVGGAREITVPPELG
jgi:FKBP-type peptidyl-prolyl cis-trans isomerase